MAQRPLLTLCRVPVPEIPPRPLRPEQEVRVPLHLNGGAKISFGSGDACTVNIRSVCRKKESQAEIEADSSSSDGGPLITFRGVFPLGLNVVERSSNTTVSLRPLDAFRLRPGDLLVFTVYAKPLLCFAIAGTGGDEKARAEVLSSIETRAIRFENTDEGRAESAAGGPASSAHRLRQEDHAARVSTERRAKRQRRD